MNSSVELIPRIFAVVLQRQRQPLLQMKRKKDIANIISEF